MILFIISCPSLNPRFPIPIKIIMTTATPVTACGVCSHTGLQIFYEVSEMAAQTRVLLRSYEAARTSSHGDISLVFCEHGEWGVMEGGSPCRSSALSGDSSPPGHPKLAGEKRGG